MKKKFLLPWAGLLVLFGCASVYEFPDQGMGASVTWSAIKASGVSLDARYVPIVDSVSADGKSLYFDIAETEKVTWWAHFKNGLALTSIGDVFFHVKWTAPGGNVFWEEDFKKSSFQNFFIKTSLPVKGSPAAKHPGPWKVEVYYEDHLISRRPFHLESSAASQISSRAVPVPQSQPPSSAVDSESPREESRFFTESYREAKGHYDKGNYEASKTVLLEILAAEPYRTEPHLMLALIHSQARNWNAALEELDYVMQNPAYRDEALRIRTSIHRMSRRE